MTVVVDVIVLVAVVSVCVVAVVTVGGLKTVVTAGVVVVVSMQCDRKSAQQSPKVLQVASHWHDASKSKAAMPQPRIAQLSPLTNVVVGSCVDCD